MKRKSEKRMNLGHAVRFLGKTQRKWVGQIASTVVGKTMDGELQGGNREKEERKKRGRLSVR